jgi:hypothetical protein
VQSYRSKDVLARSRPFGEAKTKFNRRAAEKDAERESRNVFSRRISLRLGDSAVAFLS